MNHVNVPLILGLLDITPEQLAEMVEKAQNAMSHRKNQKDQEVDDFFEDLNNLIYGYPDINFTDRNDEEK